MITVVIAGGSGTRLWPISTPQYPKHLLAVVGEESLLQNACRRASMLGDTVYVVTEAGHAHLVREQLPHLSEDAFIIEPARRGTAGCILAGLVHISTRHEAGEPIVFIHADHVIRDADGFAFSCKSACEVALLHQGITLIGIEPTHPATGFGYIKKTHSPQVSSVYQVERFEEKPSYDTAQAYVQSGQYLWNCGYFAGSLAIFVDALQKFSPPWYEKYQELARATSPEEYQKSYLSCENNAIDYVLLEPNSELFVVSASFDWMDVGSFDSMHQAVARDETGNHLAGLVEVDKVENSLIINKEDKPLAVIGLDNVVVVNTPQGILVARKDLSQHVKELTARFNT